MIMPSVRPSVLHFEEAYLQHVLPVRSSLLLLNQTFTGITVAAQTESKSLSSNDWTTA